MRWFGRRFYRYYGTNKHPFRVQIKIPFLEDGFLLLTTMSLRKILHFPNPRLRLKSAPVEKFDSELQSLIDDMFETMYEDNGVGLAANQIDVQKQLFIIDLGQNQKQQHVFINPEILEKEGSIKLAEGCLSIPSIEAEVKRAEKIKIKALDRHGKPFELTTEGLLAVCIQHEHDHLNGILFIDHLSSLKQHLIKKKMEKLKNRTL